MKNRDSYLIGAAGNSGWTERPHLHMQLIQSESTNYWSDKGLCIRYGNKKLYKNRLIEIIAILLVIKDWTNDVPSLYHAIILRQVKKIMRNKFFNG